MRMNRGTIVIIIASIIVIAVAVVLQVAAPGQDTETQTDATGTGTPVAQALFPGVDASNIVRFEIRNNQTGQRTVLVKNTDAATWDIEGFEGFPPETTIDPLTGLEVPVTEEAGPPPRYEVDQVTTSDQLNTYLTLQSVDTFEQDDLAQFGLDHPAYTVFAVNDDGAVYALHIGDPNPGHTRYYTVVRQLAVGESAEDIDLQPDLSRLDVETSLDENALPVEGTQEASAPTQNPTIEAFSATMLAVTDEAEATELAATFSAMIEESNQQAAATEPAPVADNSEAAAEGTAESTSVAQSVERLDVETSLTEDVTAEAGSEEATPAAEQTARAEVTVEPVAPSLVELRPPQTVVLVPARTIDALIGLIDTPPVFEATPEVTDIPNGMNEPTVVPGDLATDLPEATDETASQGALPDTEEATEAPADVATEAATEAATAES